MAVTEADVKAIIETSYAEAAITPFLETAQSIVTVELAGAHPTARLDLIEKWLAAHFVAIAEPEASPHSASVGESSFVATGMTRSGLRSTRYGQQALLLDTSGTLDSLSAGKIANLTFMGTEYVAEPSV